MSIPLRRGLLPPNRKPYITSADFLRSDLRCRVVAKNVKEDCYNPTCSLECIESDNSDLIGLSMDWVDKRKLMIWGVSAHYIGRIENGVKFTMISRRPRVPYSAIETIDWEFPK